MGGQRQSISCQDTIAKPSKRARRIRRAIVLVFAAQIRKIGFNVGTKLIISQSVTYDTQFYVYSLSKCARHRFLINAKLVFSLGERLGKYSRFAETEYSNLLFAGLGLPSPFELKSPAGVRNAYFWRIFRTSNPRKVEQREKYH